MHALAVENGFTAHIRSRGEELAARVREPHWRARRWVVEAAHSWLNRNRGILIRWSKKDENHLALLQLASGLIAFKKAHAAGLPAISVQWVDWPWPWAWGQVSSGTGSSRLWAVKALTR